MRRLPVVLTALGLVAASLVGCSASSSTAAGCPRPAPSSTAALGLVDVTGAPNAAPVVTVRAPLHTTGTEWQDIAPGSGNTITGDPNQLVVLDVTLVSGQTGLRTVSTQYDGNLAAVFPISQWTSVFPGLGTALRCAAEGARVAVALGPDGISLANAGNIGIADGDSAVLVVDLRKVYLSAADGTDVYNDAHGLPTVVRAPDGRPGVIIPDGSAPSPQVVQVVERGDGATVGKSDIVRVQLTVVDWATRTVKNTTWDGAAQAVDLSAANLPAGFADALVGQTVGSEILIVTPASGSQGATASVIDIVGIDAARK